MSSLYLNRLSGSDRDILIRKLYDSQNGKCFICEEVIDLELHKGSIDIDHVIPTKLNGPDNPSNFALTHSSCNRSKQASDLNVARILQELVKLRDSIAIENRGPNMGDILKLHGGSKYKINFKINGSKIQYSLPEIGKNEINELPIYKDDLSGFEYFFTNLPLEYIYHDDKINPRSIGSNISKLIQEFYLKRPQLHVSLAWISTENGASEVKIFDGQHKASAQLLLHAKNLPVRIFINPHIDTLLTTNTNAGTVLRQVAFDKSVQRHLGSALYLDRVERYKNDLGLSEDDYKFSERDLVKYFKGESREMKKYILDSVRDTITHNPNNKLKDYIDFGGRAKDRPLSYSTIEKTFYSFFIYQDLLETPLEYMLDEGDNPRELEKEQILNLMNILSEEVFIGKFDSDIGTFQIESRLQKGDTFPIPHLRAYRMSKEEIMYNWLKYIAQIIKNYFIMQGKPIKENKLFQYKFPEPLWDRIRIFIANLSNLPVWINKGLSSTVFGGKQVNDYWQTIFETGRSPQGLTVLSQPIDLMEMIKEKDQA
jgi:hypothetical protein